MHSITPVLISQGDADGLIALHRSLFCNVDRSPDQSSQQAAAAIADMQALIMNRRQTDIGALSTHIHRAAGAVSGGPAFVGGGPFVGSALAGLGMDAMSIPLSLSMPMPLPLPQLPIGPMALPVMSPVDVPQQPLKPGLLASLAAGLGVKGGAPPQTLAVGGGGEGGHHANTSALLAAVALEQQREEAAASVLATLGNPLGRRSAVDGVAAFGKRPATGPADGALDMPKKRHQHERDRV